jgi:formylglycine-generating enzyme required for sulfatase activity
VAQWEFAARGGNKSKGYKYAGSNYLDEAGWFGGEFIDQTHPVGRKRPNEPGIYDMSGRAPYPELAM